MPDKIACDIDGVLVDFHTPYLKFLHDRYSIDAKHEDFSTNSAKLWGDSAEYDRRLEAFYSSEYADLVVLHEGAQEWIQRLAKEGVWIEAITSRPGYMKQRTQEELDKNFPGAFKAIDFSVNKDGKRKLDLCKKRGLTIMIEDTAWYAAECSEAGMKVLLFDRTWNHSFDEKKYPNITRALSWKHIYELLTQKI